MKKILIVCPYPEGKAPSQRFRFEQYLPYLRENGLEIWVASFWNANQWPGIYGGTSIGYRVLSTVMAFLKRFFLVFTLHQYDTVFIHREATPIGPPWWEWCAAKVFRKRLIYDFDDAVWLPNSSKANAKLVGRFKNHSKTGKIISWSEVVFAGNSFLADYAKRFCGNVKIVPTTIDCEKLHNRRGFDLRREGENMDEAVPTPSETIPQKGGMSGSSQLGRVGINSKTDKSKIYPVSLGWTGTHSTLKQLEPLFPLLEKVHSQHPFRFLLIADIPPDVMPDFVEFRKWNKETEIADLLEMDIGIMPLYDTDWERGKCGFKALQYMALEIPAVVSAVGVNTEIVEDGLNGFICEVIQDNDKGKKYLKWESDLLKLLANPELRMELGKAGRKRIVNNYSVEAFKKDYLANLSQ